MCHASPPVAWYSSVSASSSACGRLVLSAIEQSWPVTPYQVEVEWELGDVYFPETPARFTTGAGPSQEALAATDASWRFVRRDTDDTVAGPEPDETREFFGALNLASPITAPEHSLVMISVLGEGGSGVDPQVRALVTPFSEANNHWIPWRAWLPSTTEEVCVQVSVLPPYGAPVLTEAPVCATVEVVDPPEVPLPQERDAAGCRITAFTPRDGQQVPRQLALCLGIIFLGRRRRDGVRR